MKKNPEAGIPCLLVLQSLDRETKPWHNLTLLAIDGSPPYHTGSLQIFIKVGDENDHSPSFQHEKYKAYLPETAPVGSIVALQTSGQFAYQDGRQSDDDGTFASKGSAGITVDQFSAIDKDEGINGRVHYSFARSTPSEIQKTFAIDSLSGKLRVVRPLSYDNGPTSWTFQIVASDGGRPSRSAMAEVTIDLEDTNNHAPTITVQSPSVYERLNDTEVPLIAEESRSVLSISENVNMTLKHLVTITVQDRDTGLGGEFACILRSPSGIISATGPSEDESAVATFGMFQLKLKGKVPQVNIYNLFAVGTFDREKTPNVPLWIVCQDKGKPRLTSSQLIQITILDENDNAPQFEFPFYKLTVREGIPNGSVVGVVRARDPDAGENAYISYSLSWPKGTKSEDMAFTVDQNGNLMSTAALDREAVPYGYNFTIVGKDNGQPSLNATAQVHIDLLDVNDCVPVFAKENYTFIINEDWGTIFKTPRLIGTLSATDCDSSEYNVITYRILDKTDLFAIDEEGALTAIALLDREVASRHTIQVIAIDGERDPSLSDELGQGNHGFTKSQRKDVVNTAIVTVQIYVEDLNDNTPTFVYPNGASNMVNVSMREEVGFVLTRIVAVDPDRKENGTIVYKILRGNHYGSFKIGRTSGDLSIMKQLRNEQKGKNTLIVEAADQGTPPGKITSTIFVMVDDSEPIGLHNGMLLDEEADKARIADGSERDYLSSKIFNVEADQLVTMCMVIGLSLVVLSLLVTAVFFFHNRRSNLKRHMRRRLRHPVQCIQNGIQLPHGRQETRHGLAGGRNTCQLKVCEGDLFDGVPGYEDKPNQNDNDTSLNRQSSTNRNKVPSKVEEPYTIRFSALQQRSPPSDGHGTKKIFRSHAISPPTLAYIFSNPPASSPISDCEKGDVLQRFGSPDMDTPSTVDQKIKTELNQPTVQVPVHTTIGNMFTLPIRAESLFQSEIWCNSTLNRRTDTNPNSSSLTTFSAERKVSEAASEASVQEQPKVLDPLHLLEGPFDCAKNQHFTAFCEKPQQLSSTSCQQPTGNPKETYVEVLLPFGHCFDSTAVGALGRMPISTPASKIRSDSDSKPQNQEPNLLHSPISVLDPITGKRIFVPPFSKSNTPLSKSGSKLQRSGTIPDNGERSCNEPKEDGGSNNDRAS
uniref:Cadherin domain-containing protein n=1 Tax=Schistocephalus solidus TaxID=70667 RepID=A0A0X3PJR4_SCHSO